MKTSYFKPRTLFSFSAHPYDIGNPIGFWKDHDDNHFLLKIYKLDEQLFAGYYKYHLAYTLENNIGSEEDFFRQVWQLVRNRIKHYEKQSPFSRNHAIHVQSIAKLQQFQKYLNSIDQWNARPAQIVIAEKEETIQQQKAEIERLQKRLAELNEYEVAQKIRIEDDYLPTVIDLVKQMRELELPSGRKLLRSDHKSPYPKMLSKYFSHGGKDIPVETSRNLNISDIRHTGYLEHYTFSQGNEIAIFKIHYNGQNKITRIEKPTRSTEFVESVYAKLANLQNKTIIIAEPETTETEFEFEQTFQKEFYENLKLKLEPFNFQIAKIEHKQYHEIYEIKKNGFTATYKFWYDGKFKFKKTELIPTRTTGLAEEINELLLEKVS